MRVIAKIQKLFILEQISYYKMADKSVGGSTIHIILVLLIITLAVSIYSLTEIRSLKGAPALTLNEFLTKLTSHEELKNYNGIPPLNIIRIDATNLGNLQAQIAGLDMSHLGKYIIQYTDRFIIYDLDNDQILTNVQLQQQAQGAQAQQAQVPQDFFNKLVAHPELKGVETVGPAGGILDEATLNTLKQQFPDVYKDAKVGDYLLRYDDRLIIYDYQADTIVGAFAVQ